MRCFLGRRHFVPKANSGARSRLVQVATFDLFDPREPSLLQANDYARDPLSGKLAGVGALEAGVAYQAWVCLLPRVHPKACDDAPSYESDDDTLSFYDSDDEFRGPRSAASSRTAASSRRSSSAPLPILGHLTLRAMFNAGNGWTQVFRSPPQSLPEVSDLSGGNASTFFRFPLLLDPESLVVDRTIPLQSYSMDSELLGNDLSAARPVASSLALAKSRVGLLSQLSRASGRIASPEPRKLEGRWKLQLVFLSEEGESVLLDVGVGALVDSKNVARSPKRERETEEVGQFHNNQISYNRSTAPEAMAA